MTLRLVPEGATITRTYLAVPNHGGIGTEFPNTPAGWNAAVAFAQEKKAALVATITESLGQFGTPEGIEKGADVQVRIDLRWKITYPAESYAGGGASGVDTTVESYKHVDQLRTVTVPDEDHPEHDECADGCGLAVTHDGACLDKPGGRQVCEHDDTECEGHESLAGEHMGETVYCDGTCKRSRR